MGRVIINNKRIFDKLNQSITYSLFNVFNNTLHIQSFCFNNFIESTSKHETKNLHAVHLCLYLSMYIYLLNLIQKATSVTDVNFWT